MKKCIVKVGGSLSDTAGTVLEFLRSLNLGILIVPGGGVFADAVRGKKLDDTSAHWQAISAMNRYGVYLSTFGFPITEDPVIPVVGVSILLPEKVLQVYDPLPHSWDVTSDSIALWIADELKMPLILMKSCDGSLEDTDYVDPYFVHLQKSAMIECFAVNGRDTKSLSDFFRKIN